MSAGLGVLHPISSAVPVRFLKEGGMNVWLLLHGCRKRLLQVLFAFSKDRSVEGAAIVENWDCHGL